MTNVRLLGLWTVSRKLLSRLLLRYLLIFHFDYKNLSRLCFARDLWQTMDNPFAAELEESFTALVGLIVLLCLVCERELQRILYLRIFCIR